MRYSIMLALLLGSLVGCATPEAQREATPIDFLPALAGDYFPITSIAVGRDYHIFVRLPEGYDADSTKRYPVVYLLDGDSLFPMIAPTHLFLTYDEELPEAILVGIAYGGFDEVNERSLDFSAPTSDLPAEQTRAPQFLQFLKSELLPKIENAYRADSERRVLVGQSRGGHFVLYSALQEPGLFWGRIASNPVSYPSKERLFEAPQQVASTHLGVVVASGTRDTEARQEFAREWSQYWSTQQNTPWQVHYMQMDNGTHAATIGETYRQAMLWLFRDTNSEVTTEEPNS